MHMRVKVVVRDPVQQMAKAKAKGNLKEKAKAKGVEKETEIGKEQQWWLKRRHLLAKKKAHR